MATTIALTNMKGGVGKSTLTANLAWTFAEHFNKRVLVVDLDPQFNASQYLLGVRMYKAHIQLNEPTIWNVLEQETRTPSTKNNDFDIHSAIVPCVPQYSSAVLDLIPSQLELAFSLETPYQNKERLLAKSLAKLSKEYDVVFLDCPPTESILTKAAYLASDWVLVPVKPEFLSTIGLPLLQESLETFRSRNPKHKLDVAGIVFNMTTQYSPEEKLSKNDVRKVAKQSGWHVFSNELKYSRSYAKGARNGLPIYKTSYARSVPIAQLRKFADELAKRIGL